MNWYIREFDDCEPDYLHWLNTSKGPFATKKEAYDFGFSYFDGYLSGSHTYSLWNAKTSEEISISDYEMTL